MKEAVMDTLYVSQLKKLLDLVAGRMPLYIPKKQGEHYFFAAYDPEKDIQPDFNELRLCSSAKEFLFPLREIAAVFPPNSGADGQPTAPFAVFGLKSCDLRAIEILDRVFREEEFLDPDYIARRENMFILSSDCINPAESCCCGLFEGQSYPAEGFDLNVSKIEDGFIIQAGSDKGRLFMQDHEERFAEVPNSALAERDQKRQTAQQQLEDNVRDIRPDGSIRDLVLNSRDSEIYKEEAAGCVECQGCTRICPTCHCFYLYDEKRDAYYDKMKIWDSCVRMGFAKVAGGENPRDKLADRSRHRLLHKFVYFLDRYGMEMCVGCGRCVDACAGEIDLREMFKRLSTEMNVKKNTKKLG